ncbi:MAG: M28 family peptidase [Kiritimatiellaeota bacterium]|nr:M28 family peptidase [Kiritimatiellota bacterium]
MALDLEALKPRLCAIVVALCKGEPRNFRNVKRLAQAGDFIACGFEALGYCVTRQAYKVKGHVYFNVVAELPVADEKPLIVVGGHYDVCGNTPGADDNASAIAAMLAVAKAWKPLAQEARVRVQFVAYTLEEPPFFNTDDMGSRVHATSLAQRNIMPEFAIVLDMLGYYNDGRQSQRYPIDIANIGRTTSLPLY